MACSPRRPRRRPQMARLARLSAALLLAVASVVLSARRAAAVSSRTSRVRSSADAVCSHGDRTVADGRITFDLAVDDVYSGEVASRVTVEAPYSSATCGLDGIPADRSCGSCAARRPGWSAPTCAAVRRRSRRSWPASSSRRPDFRVTGGRRPHGRLSGGPGSSDGPASSEGPGSTNAPDGQTTDQSSGDQTTDQSSGDQNEDTSGLFHGGLPWWAWTMIWLTVGVGGALSLRRAFRSRWPRRALTPPRCHFSRRTVRSRGPNRALLHGSRYMPPDVPPSGRGPSGPGCCGPGWPIDSAIPGGSARRICSSCARAAICCASSAVWMPWNRPSSQPDELGLGDAQLGLRRARRRVNGSDSRSQLLDQLRREPLLELADRRAGGCRRDAHAARLVQRRRPHLLEQLADHAADPHHLGRLFDQVGEGPLSVVVRAGRPRLWSAPAIALPARCRRAGRRAR